MEGFVGEEKNFVINLRFICEPVKQSKVKEMCCPEKVRTPLAEFS